MARRREWRPALQSNAALYVGCGVDPGVTQVVADAFDQRGNIDPVGFLGEGLILRQGQRRFRQMLHVGDQGLHALAIFVVVHQIGPQAQSGDGRAQIVADTGQHFRAPLNKAA